MKKKLTEIAVQKLAPEAGKRLEVFDTLTPGLALRITEGGKKSWSVMYRVAGREIGGGSAAIDDAIAAEQRLPPHLLLAEPGQRLRDLGRGPRRLSRHGAGLGGLTPLSTSSP